MAIDFFKLKHQYLLSAQRTCRLVYRTICSMSSVCCIFRTCLKRICRPVSFVHILKRNVFTADADELTHFQSTIDLGFSFTSCNCGSANMADVEGSVTKQCGDSSVLPSALLDMVTKSSRSVLSQQSNSIEMPDDYSSDSECPRSEQMRNVTTPDSAMVVISEDSGPHLDVAEACHMSPESLDSVISLFGDELVALFDSDNQKESNTTVVASSNKSEFLPLLMGAYYSV